MNTVAKYLRISSEDVMKTEETESVSIVNQRHSWITIWIRTVNLRAGTELNCAMTVGRELTLNVPA